MNSSDPYPKLPLWIFFAADFALMGAAFIIAVWSSHPLPSGAILGIVVCVALGAIVALVPLVARYERIKNETLDERQRELAALAGNVASSAEQISIAATGLHQIGELASKNVRLAEHLPHKLQDKMAEFQALLASATDAEKEELERELLALRTTESERLDSVSQRIAKLSSEWSKLEVATHEHLTAANEAVAKLAFGTASAIGQAQAAAEQALSQARVEAARAVGEASGHATREVESAKTAALAHLDARFAAATATMIERVAHELTAHLARIEPRAATAATRHEAAGDDPSSAGSRAPGGKAADDVQSESRALTEVDVTRHESNAQPVKRPRKTRREDAAAVPPEGSPPDITSPDTPSPSESPGTAASAAMRGAGPDAAPGSIAPEEPQPIPAEKIFEVAPVAPDTPEPFPGHLSKTPNGTPHGAGDAVSHDAAAATDPARSPRKRPTRKGDSDDEPGLGLDLGDAPAHSTSTSSDRVLTSDGATRLHVTAYIGIGNRLYIRGEGPGLSWEKGAPLQFVSIGKWRWETNDATAPVIFKLYKNDDVECRELGAQTLDPGHQQEVTAAF